MPTNSYTVSQAAAIVNVSPSTLRNWTRQFAGHLSDSATPEQGSERVLTSADVAILQHIKELRDRHMSYDEIPAQLEQLDTIDLQPYVDVPTSVVPPQPAPAGQDALQLAVGLLQAFDDRTAPLQQRIEAIEEGQVSRLTWFVWGFLCGLLTALIAIAALWLGAR